MMDRVIFTAWVLRASMVGFTVGCKVLLKHVPCFGDLVKVRTQDNFGVYGLIYDVAARDDLAARQLILAGELEPEVVLDQQQNRLALTEIGVLTVGYENWSREVIYGLPPQPPVSLDLLTVCDGPELRAFTAGLGYLSLILNAPFVPADELLAVHLLQAAGARASHERYPFLLTAGREVARQLYAHQVRLEGILGRIRPMKGEMH
jgi:hypothetical protein